MEKRKKTFSRPQAANVHWGLSSWQANLEWQSQAPLLKKYQKSRLPSSNVVERNEDLHDITTLNEETQTRNKMNRKQTPTKNKSNGSWKKHNTKHNTAAFKKISPSTPSPSLLHQSFSQLKARQQTFCIGQARAVTSQKVLRQLGRQEVLFLAFFWRSLQTRTTSQKPQENIWIPPTPPKTHKKMSLFFSKVVGTLKLLVKQIDSPWDPVVSAPDCWWSKVPHGNQSPPAALE